MAAMRNSVAIALICAALTSAGGASPKAWISWSGVVQIGDGIPVAGASVLLHSTFDSHEYSTVTDVDGKFTIGNVLAGHYQVSVSVHGTTYSGSKALACNGSFSSIVQLGARDSAQGLVIFSPIGVSESRGGEHLSSSEVSSLPLNSRDFSKLLLLAAGTMTDSNGAANFTQQFAVNGQRGNATVFALDSSDTTDPEMGGATFNNFNVDAIQEVQANSGVMSPDIGHGAASYTNVVSKSGSDQVHGSIFEFVRNSAFDARNYFDPPSSISHRRIPPFVRNEFGFTNGGPFVLPGLYDGIGRTYYFGEYQGFRQVLGTTQVFAVPTAAEREGIDTATFPGDTLTVPVNPAISPVLNGYPLPNTPNGPDGPRTYAGSSKVSTTTDQFSIRIDHRISAAASLLARFSLNQVTGPTNNPDQTAINPKFAVQFFDHQRSATVKYTRSVSAHFSFETSIGYIRSTPFFPSSDHQQPAIQYGDGLFESYNAAGGSIYGSYSNLYQLQHHMTAIQSSHTFKWGVELRANRDSTIFGVNPNGAYSFGGGTAYSPVFIPSASGMHDIHIGDPLPDSLVGLLTATPYSFSITAAASFTPVGDRFNEAGVRREAYEFYLQDAWKVTPRLTVNYGLRYGVNSRIHEPTKRTSGPRFFKASGRPASYWDHTAQQTFLVDPQPPYNQDWSGVGPRLSLDYAATSRTVLHVGGAVTTLLPNLWQDNFLTAGLPFVFSPSITAQPGAPVPFSNSFVPLQLPTAYATNRQPVFPAGTSTSVRPNTILDVDRFQADIAALTPGNQVQLPTAVGMDRSFRNGYIGTYSAGFDRDFGDVKVSAGYVATVGVHLAFVYSPNSYVGASQAFAPYTKFDSLGHPISGYGQESLMTSSSHSSYHSLQASVSKKSARAGLGLQGSYTYSKSLDDTSAVLGGLLGASGVVLQTSPQDPWNPRAEKGPSTFDVTHVFTLSAIQLLPLERVSFLRPLGRTLTYGWQLLNVTTLTTGSPFTVFSGIQQTGAGTAGADRPDLIAHPHLSTSRAQRDDYFGLGANNNSLFFIPINVAGGTGPNQGRFGTLGRDTFRGPAFHDFDIAVIKDTPFGHRGNTEFGTVELRAEFFNVFNAVNFGLPNNVVRGSGFGVISKTAGSSRQIQFSVKLIY